MKKSYQTKAAPAATDELVMPDTVNVAMVTITEYPADSITEIPQF